MRHKNTPYPQWFIDALLYDKDKERAREGTLKSSEYVWFLCNNGHRTKALVSTKINISTMTQKRMLCGICSRSLGNKKVKSVKNKKRIYPKWFIDELINDDDKKKALSGELTTNNSVLFKYPCGHIKEQRIGDHINMITKELKHGCPICGIKKRIKSKSITLSSKRKYPDWFIDDLYDPEVKLRALKGDLVSNEPVFFKCKKCGSIYEQLVHNHISLCTQTERWLGCPHCIKIARSNTARTYKRFQRIDFPQWFLDLLVNEEDKERAINKELVSSSIVRFKCNICNKEYDQLVGNKINMTTGKEKRGCPYCAKELIGNNVRKYRENKRSYPEWFIHDLVNENDKERAKSKKLCSYDYVCFQCPKGHVYYQEVQNHICLHNGTKRYGCPICAKGCFRSKSELSIESFIQSLGFNVDHKRFKNDYSGFFEIDVFIPEKKIGIEYNGSYYHKSLPNKDPFKEKLYHLNKYDACKSLGIKLISIFEPDWSERQDKVKQYLKDMLLPKESTLYARKCSIKQIDYREANDMYDKYHLLGKTTVQSISYGLFYNDELVSCMSFQKGRYKENKESVWCLTRFVTKSGLTVVGGASKLLKQFEKEFNPSLLISFSDNDYFSGGVYEKLGFENKGYTSTPRYFWFLHNKEIKREQCQLKKLAKKYPELYKESLGISGNKENYIMLTLGAFKVYRSGHTKWIKEYKH